ncbi:MAG: NIL domain-containing protein [Chloroflexi bacterium]|nr:NIL domain-containing protein [Chloroflexota bacterium]MCH7983433.1 NIL domain-containing protein [Chloroflexota bacterium]MCH8114534.1 NIL domain-containing protein [Chloroflexota bacterium]MCH8229880.1 NIL domain-containing protein [Chloroflexota bacterium]MCH8911842.1 NIL domain-containing protein [Chloroflexota bacterium]
MPLRRVTFTFKTDLIQRPVIYELGKKFDIVTNIRRAEVGQDNGWVVLELEGTLDEIDRGLAWVVELGVDVSPLDGDILVG